MPRRRVRVIETVAADYDIDVPDDATPASIQAAVRALHAQGQLDQHHHEVVDELSSLSVAVLASTPHHEDA